MTTLTFADGVEVIAVAPPAVVDVGVIPGPPGPPGEGGGGGGAGTVVSVNGIEPDETGDIELGAADVGASPTGHSHSYASTAQGALADTAVQPDDLAPVATSGAYSDLSGTPTIPDSPDDIGAATVGHNHGGVYDPAGSASTAQAAAEATAAGALTAHTSDATAAHAASAVSFSPTGALAATDVQAALAELDTEKSATGHGHAGSDITSGTVAFARLPTGTSSSTVSIGDHTHAGSATGVVHRVTGTPSAGTGSDGDWAWHSDGTFYRKASGAWSIVGWVATQVEEGTFVSRGFVRLGARAWEPPAASTWTATGTLSTPGGWSLNFSGSTANASRHIDVGKSFNVLNAMFTITSLPVGGSYAFGAAVRLGASLYPAVVVSPAGAATLNAGGVTIATFPTTVAAGHSFTTSMPLGAVLVCHRDASGNILGEKLFASDYAQIKTLEAAPAAFRMGAVGTVTSGLLSMSNGEVVL